MSRFIVEVYAVQHFHCEVEVDALDQNAAAHTVKALSEDPVFIEQNKWEEHGKPFHFSIGPVREK